MTEEVLSSPELRESGPGLLGRILSAIGEWLGRVLLPILELGGGNVAVGRAVVLALVVAVLLLVVWFARGVRRGAAAAPGLDGPVGRPAEDWLADAQRHERAQEWRDTVRCRYRWLLARLAAHGLVEEVPGRTSGEYLRDSARALPSAEDELRAITSAFERAWYGEEPVGPSDVAALTAAAERVVAGLPGRPVLAGATAGRARGQGPASS